MIEITIRINQAAPNEKTKITTEHNITQPSTTVESRMAGSFMTAIVGILHALNANVTAPWATIADALEDKRSALSTRTFVNVARYYYSVTGVIVRTKRISREHPLQGYDDVNQFLEDIQTGRILIVRNLGKVGLAELRLAFSDALSAPESRATDDPISTHG